MKLQDIKPDTVYRVKETGVLVKTFTMCGFVPVDPKMDAAGITGDVDGWEEITEDDE